MILTTFFSVVLLTTGGFIYEKDKISRYFFQNKVVTYIGKISFSLYLWHQLIFAFARYTLIEEVDFISSLILVALTFLLSVLTYNYIENIFRNKHVLSTKRVLSILGVVFLLTSSSAMYIYFFGGVYKDFPSLGISKEVVEDRGLNFFSSADNVNIFYNEKVRAFDRDFENNGLKKVLVLGDSYGRDVVNILQEHSKGVEIDLTYFDLVRAKKDSDIVKRWNQADVVICTSKAFFNQKKIEELEVLHNANLDKDKLYVFGTKNFGYSSGIHYNRMSSITEFSEYYANMRKNTLDLEKEYQDEWGDKHISIISSVINEDGKIRIFDDEGKFLSQDTLHLTKAGAVFFAKVLDKQIIEILES